jgi:hypothetical protein
MVQNDEDEEGAVDDGSGWNGDSNISRIVMKLEREDENRYALP